MNDYTHADIVQIFLSYRRALVDVLHSAGSKLGWHSRKQIHTSFCVFLSLYQDADTRRSSQTVSRMKKVNLQKLFENIVL